MTWKLSDCHDDLTLANPYFQHEELREVLAADSSIPESLLEDLYGVRAKPVQVMHAGSRVEPEPEEQVAHGPTITSTFTFTSTLFLTITPLQTEQQRKEERERIAQEVRKKEMLRYSGLLLRSSSLLLLVLLLLNLLLTLFYFF